MSSDIRSWTGTNQAQYLTLLELARRNDPARYGLREMYAGTPQRKPTPDEEETYWRTCWEVVSGHPFHARLFRNKNFSDAWRLYKKRRPAPQAADGSNALQEDLVFLERSVEVIGLYYFVCARGISPPGATSTRRKQGLAAIKRLTSLLESGISLDSYSETVELKTLLRKLEMQVKAAPRKQYKSKAWREVWFVETLGKALQEHPLRISSPTILEHFAALIGYVPDESTIKRRLKGVRTKRSD